MKFLFRNIMSLAVVLSVFMGGCSVKKLALNKIAGALSAEGGTVFSGDDDPQLVADALPFALKMYESLLESLPENQDLLIATGKAFCMYAYAFVHSPADTIPDFRITERTEQYARAKKLYLRARAYLLRAMDLRHPGWTSLMEQGKVDSALAMNTVADTTLLYWTAASWMGAFTSDKFDMTLAVDMYKPVACMHRVDILSETYGRGAAKEFFISYYGSLPASMGGSHKKAREYYEKVLSISGDSKAGPHVSLATSVSVAGQNVEEFRNLLNKAIAVDTDADPANRLANIISKNKAKWLLSNIDNFFLITDPEEFPNETGKNGEN